jgi:nucleotidyltransferase/DNA polymerase involved in DNA repair
LRKIVFIKLNGIEFSGELLDFCSTFTPLVEPRGNNEVFLDLTGVRQTWGILKNIAERIYADYRVKAQMGLATSKLLARIAATAAKLPTGNSDYRVINREELNLIQVLPGREQEFIASLPLTDFYPLDDGDLKKLTRLGYCNVGEITALSPQRLTALLGKEVYLLSQYSQGKDSAPVLGLYPPLRIIYPSNFDEAVTDSGRIGREIRRAAGVLSTLMESRHCGCRNITLDLITTAGRIREERVLSSICWDAKQLFNILSLLWKKAGSHNPLLNFTITLGQICTLQVVQQDLFTNRPSYHQEQRRDNLENTIDNLLYRFPDMIRRGIDTDRREQVLAFWDPWRFPEKEAGR